MSSSRHPIALSIERQVGGATRLLAVVMLLPLVDGIFPALVLAGALDSVAGVFEVGLLVFGGSATVAVVLAEMEGSPRERALSVLAVGVPLAVLAVLEAALAPTLASVLDLVVFERFAAVVIVAVAAATASARVGEYLPRPAVIIVLGLLASLQPAGAALSVQVEPGLLLRALGSAVVGVGFAATVALASPTLAGAVDIDRFRFGSAVALGVLGLSVLGLGGDAPLALAVLAVTALLALDPGEDDAGRTDEPAPEDGPAAAVPTVAAADSGDEEENGESYVYGAGTAAKLRREGNA